MLAATAPAECNGIVKHRVEDNPSAKHVSTSYAERQNLTMRMSRRAAGGSLLAMQEIGLKESLPAPPGYAGRCIKGLPSVSTERSRSGPRVFVSR